MTCPRLPPLPCKVWGDNSEPLSFAVDYSDGTAIIWDSGTITIIDPRGTEVVSAAAMVLDETDEADDTLAWTPTYAWTRPSAKTTYRVWLSGVIAGAAADADDVKLGPFEWTVLPFGH
jgi:hypothetical protein